MAKGRLFCSLTILAALSLIIGHDSVIDSSDWILIGVVLVGISSLIAVLAKYQFANRSKQRELDTTRYTPLWLSYKRILTACIGFYLPYSGKCLRCNIPWVMTKPHITRADGLFGMQRASYYAVCEDCFSTSDLDTLNQYYTMKFARYMVNGLTPTYRHLSDGTIINYDWYIMQEALINDLQENGRSYRKDNGNHEAEHHSDCDRHIG